MLRIELLKNHPNCIPRLIEIWHQAIGKKWSNDTSFKERESWFNEWLNDVIPLALVALINQEPVGMCSLQFNDGIRTDLSPWSGDLCVDPNYSNQGIGKLLISTVVQKASDLKYKEVFLYTYEENLISYYEKLGWNLIGNEVYGDHQVKLMSRNIFI